MKQRSPVMPAPPVEPVVHRCELCKALADSIWLTVKPCTDRARRPWLAVCGRVTCRESAARDGYSFASQYAYLFRYKEVTHVSEDSDAR